MASGIGERPLLSPTEEKSLMRLGGLTGVMRWEMTAGTTRYLVFDKQFKIGMLSSWGATSQAAKSGLYHLYSSSSSTITLTAVKAANYSGLTISPLNNQVIQIVNPSSSGYLWIAVLMFYGNLPAIQTTNPT